MVLSVRPRRPGDLPALLVLLARTHARDGYPVRSTAVSATWLAAPGELYASVALDGDRVVGHVALHPGELAVHDPGEADALRQWQAATGRPPEELAVVSRLYTDRSVRGSGTALLADAVDAAGALGRVPVLLVDPDSSARDFYVRRGWREVGTAVQQWGHRTVDAALFVSGSG